MGFILLRVGLQQTSRLLVPEEQALRRPRKVTQGQPCKQSFRQSQAQGEHYTETAADSQKESAKAKGIKRRLQLHGHPKARIHICITRGSTEQN